MNFLCAWITGSCNQKLAMAWIMPSLALLLHIVYQTLHVTGQGQTNIYLA